MFSLERPAGLLAENKAEEPGLLSGLGGGDLRLCMSGRCALYYCLLDLKQGDAKRVAYLPAYTCETVIAPYKKAGYELRFYDVTPQRLTPQFDRAMIPHISVLGLCGYYGFSSYDRSFVEDCAAAGVAVIQDITHSVFSAGGIDAHADYIAGSLRKWMGIPSGGIALKRKGLFTLPLLPPDEEHIRGRLACFGGASEEEASDIFWTTEMRLRQMFDAYESDRLSSDIIAHYPCRDLIRRRRENYVRILSRSPFSPRLSPVFPELPDGVCPSHLALYSPGREEARSFLAGCGIKSTVYWPFHNEFDLSGGGPAGSPAWPGAAYIYGHIFSVPMDQRYGVEDMDLLCDALAEL
jgi:hypothetical protein